MRPQQKTPSKGTPSKGHAAIEGIKRSLSAKWGIQFPARDSTWSPSKRNPNRVEENVLKWIQFLYFRKEPQEGALDYALNQFEENAVQIISKWRFKPHGEAEVLPTLEEPRSALKQDFLKKRPALSEREVTELTENLNHFLESIVDRVKAGEKFPQCVRVGGKSTHFWSQQRLAETVLDGPDPANEISPTKPVLSERQSSLRPWLRSERESGPAKDEVSPAQLPSSSMDYLDNEMVELMANADAMNMSSTVPTLAEYARKACESAISEHSSSDDAFETPPTSPPLHRSSSLGVSTDRKRSHPDSIPATLSRIVSRKTSNEKSAQEVSGLTASNDRSVMTGTDFELLQSSYLHSPRKIGPTRPLDRASATILPKSQHHIPRQPARNNSFESESARLVASFDNTASLSNSMTTASSAWTSPNTSFSSRSLVTSFDTSIDGIDSTTRGFRDNPSRPPLLGPSLSGLESNVGKCFKMEANKVSTHKTTAQCDPMDVESEPSFLDLSTIKAEPMYPNLHDKAKTSENNVGMLLAERLSTNSPFGNLSPS